MDIPSRDQWLEWLSHNLALGVAEGKLTDEMLRAGVSRAEGKRLIDEILASPLHRATKRVGSDLRKWMLLSDALLDLESHSVDFSRIPRVAGLSSDDFLRNYYSLNRPVIIEDTAKKWPALSKWNLGFLREHYGSEEVTYQQGRSADDHRESFIDHSKSGPFSDFIQLIESGGRTNDHYLIAHDRLLERESFRPLLDDIVFDERYFDAVNTQGRVFFWLGPPGSTTPMHRDLANVYFVQISGRKTVKMIPSKQMHKIYNEIGYHSEVDFEDWSLKEYPLLKEAYIAEETIAPGETLFIPLGWWHHIKALDVSITITGNNFRFMNSFTPIF